MNLSGVTLSSYNFRLVSQWMYTHDVWSSYSVSNENYICIILKMGNTNSVLVLQLNIWHTVFVVISVIRDYIERVL
jgi:hypothetical protein